MRHTCLSVGYAYTCKTIIFGFRGYFIPGDFAWQTDLTLVQKT